MFASDWKKRYNKSMKWTTLIVEKKTSEYEMLEKRLENTIQVREKEDWESHGGDLNGVLYLVESQREAEWALSQNMAVAGYSKEGKTEILTRYLFWSLEDITREDLQKCYDRCQGIPWTIMVTKRCILREQTLEDIPELYRIYQDKSITAYMENLYPLPEETEYMKQYIEVMYGYYELGLWLIIRKDTGEVMGRAGLTPGEYLGAGELELGYVLGEKYQHQGYATEVCMAIMNWAKEAYPNERVSCRIHPDNAASIALAERIGLKEDKNGGVDGKNLVRYCN